MNELKNPILSSTIYVLLMVLSPLLGNLKITMILVLGLPFVMVWLVVRILKTGKPSGRNFEEYFYDDREMVRVRSNEKRDPLN